MNTSASCNGVSMIAMDNGSMVYDTAVHTIKSGVYKSKVYDTAMATALTSVYVAEVHQ